FIAVAVVILILVLVLFYMFKGFKGEPEERLPANVAPIRLYLDRCLQNIANDAVLTVSEQGGYYILPEKSFDFLNIGVPYYVYNKEMIAPSKEIIQDELSIYLELNAHKCSDFDSFKAQGFDVSVGIPEVKTSLIAKEVFFEVEFPVKVYAEEEEQEYKFSKFDITTEADLTKILYVTYRYLKFQEEDMDSLFISRMMELANEYELGFEIFTFDSTRVVSLIENKTGVGGEPLIFAFALQWTPLNATGVLMLNETAIQNVTG
ncbi:hypothetical protein ACFL6I_23415, partial [candidate division KSB1 bacterium]